jgi:hypothetical protein
MNLKDIRVVALAFFVLAIALRFLPHPYNMAPIAALALFAGCYISGRIGLVLAFGAMAASDLLGHWFEVPSMGFYNRSTMLTVYLALGLTAVVGAGLRGRVNLATVPLASLLGTAIFFLSTNFASWLDPQMGYAASWQGLVSCYVAAIPFARNSLIGDLFYSGLLFGLYNAAILPRFSPAAKRSCPVE